MAIFLKEKPLQHEETVPCFHSLRINGLNYLINLGCTEQERMQPQSVLITIEFRFLKPPKGFFSDSLSDTLCFAEVATTLEKHFIGREYSLIEKLANDVLVIARKMSQNLAKVGIVVDKVNPPLANLKNGATYRCGDFFA